MLIFQQIGRSDIMNTNQFFTISMNGKKQIENFNGLFLFYIGLLEKVKA